MNKISKVCQYCKTIFSTIYYAKVEDDDVTNVCSRCWNKHVSKFWTSTRDVLKNNRVSQTNSNFEKFRSKNDRQQFSANRYLWNLTPESTNKKTPSHKQEKPTYSNTPTIPWLVNHSSTKESFLSSVLDQNVDVLIKKLKG